MKLRFGKILGILAGTIAFLAATGYWYIFIAGAPQLDPPQVERNTGLTFQLETFNSKAMGEVRTYGLILPPGYTKNSVRRYPVIFLLHGGHGDARAYQDKAAVTSVLHDLYKSGKLPPSIVITPDGNDRRGSSPFWDSDYYDGANGNVGTLIGSELVQVVKSRYRTLEQPQFWAMGGQSSGGWGAFNIGLRHLNNFNIFFSSSGYFTDTSGAANSPQLFIKQISATQRQQIRAFLDAGEADREFLDSTQQFHQTLNQLGIANEFRVFPGGHGIVGGDFGWNYWHKHLTDQLSYVGQQFKIALAKENKIVKSF
ncbi:alpha/beta hydrolase [Chroococcidiopsis thermalis]|uniref:Esterase n=1 Tax=Chroococcidiopsis thermalis (strain PCC 7203) TaxID=251229 RepID=K9U8Y8_CHRTP|nr:alpha/beta hydrolase-fold protein [Chroococcidiopsis thermalis]AFY91265.1 esterase [Chroococcidiopsis thermalis PCC 7203]